MRTRTLVAAVVALLVVAGGAAVLADVVPFPGGSADTPSPTATTAPPGGGTATPGGSPPDDGGGTGTASPTAADPNATETPHATFRIEIRNVEECGTTCRNVTLALLNVGTAPASGVSASVTLYAGNSTAEGDAVWTGSEDVGTLDAGGTYTTTRRVSLSFTEAFAVRQANGWVTIETTIRTDERTVTFTERRDVL